jgi:transcriptional regulator with XRE-family HTH domain
MDDGKTAVGTRIRECAEKKAIKGPQALCDLLLVELQKRTPRQTITRQTVSNWWHGKVWPSLDMLPALATVLGTEQEWILFGSRRGDQLKRERIYLSRISEEEMALLTVFRETSKSGQRSILKMVKTLAEDNPAPEASVHPMRRKDDIR